MTRTNLLLSLRDKVLYSETHTDATHQFQDEVLRPILKFQHPILIGFFEEFLVNHKINLLPLELDAKVARIRLIIKQHAELQHTLRAFILALFSEDELAFWVQHKKAINKRLTEMITARILSTLA